MAWGGCDDCSSVRQVLSMRMVDHSYGLALLLNTPPGRALRKLHSVKRKATISYSRVTVCPASMCVMCVCVCDVCFVMVCGVCFVMVCDVCFVMVCGVCFVMVCDVCFVMVCVL